ncbi:MAG: preprotein translocase subunit SecE [Holosporales bacterium]|nr:preprotein translocase subunit SecE [Holosporales bacterium]
MSWYRKSSKFLSEVVKEVSQVVWPSRKEVSISTIVICIFACIMAAYLFLIDRGLLFIIQSIMG